MDSKSDESSIKSGNIKSVTIAAGLLLLIFTLLIYSIYKILLPINALLEVDDKWIHYTYYTYGIMALLTLTIIGVWAWIHRVGFRWFTPYNKITRPDLSWLIIVEALTEIFILMPVGVLAWYYTQEVSNVIQEGISAENIPKIFRLPNFALFIAVFLVVWVAMYYVLLSIITRLIIPVSIGVALRSSILNLLLVLLSFSPLIAYYGWSGMKMKGAIDAMDNRLQSQHIKQTPSQKIEASPIQLEISPNEQQEQILLAEEANKLQLPKGTFRLLSAEDYTASFIPMNNISIRNAALVHVEHERVMIWIGCCPKTGLKLLFKSPEGGVSKILPELHSEKCRQQDFQESERNELDKLRVGKGYTKLPQENLVWVDCRED